VGLSGAHERARVHPHDRSGALRRRLHVEPRIQRLSRDLGVRADRPCEPACRRDRVDGQPVAICRLKRVASDLKGDISERLRHSHGKERQAHCLYRFRTVGTHGRQRPLTARLRGRDVRAVRQAGRAHAHQHPRVPSADHVLEDETQVILDMGVKVRYNTPITSLRSLLGEGFDAIFVGSVHRAVRNWTFPVATTKPIRTSSSVSIGSSRWPSVTSLRRLEGLDHWCGQYAMDCCRSSRRLGGTDIK